MTKRKYLTKTKLYCTITLKVFIMKKEWSNVIITNVTLALHVTTNNVKYHANRPNHGFVINNEKRKKVKSQKNKEPCTQTPCAA